MTTAAIFWGEGTLPGNLQTIDDVDGAPLLTVENQSIQTVYPIVVQLALETVDGEAILTVDNEPIIAMVAGTAAPRYWETSEAAADGGIPFEFVYETDPWQPSAQGGENVFVWLYLTLSWSLGATVRVIPKVDGSSDDVTLQDGSTLEFVSPVFQLEQQGGSLQRQTQVFPIPLVRRQMRSGVEVARYNLRGQRLQFTIESTGPLGVGECMLEGAQVDYRPVRKAIYATVDAQG